MRLTLGCGSLATNELERLPRALAAKPGIPLIACESVEEMDSVTYMGNRGFAGENVGVDRGEKLGWDGSLWRSGLQTDRGES